MNLKNDVIIQPTWSFDLLNHIQTQYPHFYNKIQKNQYKFEIIEFNGETSNLLTKFIPMNYQYVFVYFFKNMNNLNQRASENPQRFSFKYISIHYI